MGNPLKLLSLPAVGMLSMCSTISAPSHCDGWAPIYPTRDDVAVISDQLTGQVLSHNMHGAQTCNWMPPSSKNVSSS